MMDSLTNVLPQGGTACSAGGESSPCAGNPGHGNGPIVSGGDLNCPASTDAPRRGNNKEIVVKNSSRVTRLATAEKSALLLEGDVTTSNVNHITLAVDSDSTDTNTSRFWGKPQKRTISGVDTEPETISGADVMPAPTKKAPAKRGRSRTTANVSHRRDLRERFLKRPGTPNATGIAISDGGESDTSAVSSMADSQQCGSKTTTLMSHSDCHSAQKRRVEVRLAELRAQEEAHQAEEGPSLETIALMVEEDMSEILELVSKCGNLKGTYVRKLKDRASSTKNKMTLIRERPVCAEMAAMQGDIRRMQTELADLRKQRVVEPPPPTVVRIANQDREELLRAIMVQVGTMVNARLESLNDRLLPEPQVRPPLAADRRQSSEGTTTVARTPKVLKRNKKAPPGVANQPTEKTGTASVSRTTDVSNGDGRLTSQKSRSQPETADGTWTEVSRRNKRNITGDRQTQPAVNNNRRTKKHKLRIPRSAAIVITLQPDAEERGVTYASVLKEAREKVNIENLGIKDLRCRKAATGARIYELPGTSSGPKADELAEKLRQILNAEDVRIARPIKCAGLRISQLDDSVSVTELVAAIAKEGGCQLKDITSGSIVRGARGVGSAWVKCPISSAKKLANSGHLAVGWVTAKVVLLPPRPARCYRCWQRGHVKAFCPSEVDRSAECYRCGRLGHKYAECSAPPHCSVCAAASKPAGHMVGGKSCHTKKVKGSKAPTTLSQVRQQEAEMVIDESQPSSQISTV